MIGLGSWIGRNVSNNLRERILEVGDFETIDASGQVLRVMLELAATSIKNAYSTVRFGSTAHRYIIASGQGRLGCTMTFHRVLFPKACV